MRIKKPILIIFGGLVLLAFSFQNCSQVSFEQGVEELSSQSSLEGETIDTPVETPFEITPPVGSFGFQGINSGSVSVSRSVQRNQQYNVFYLIDVSGSVAVENMDIALKAFSALTKAYNSGSMATLSIVRFRGTADLVGRYSNHTVAPNGNLMDAVVELERGLQNKFRPGTSELRSGTNYSAGLDRIRQELNQVNSSESVKNVFYFFTDGEPNGGSISNPTTMTSFLNNSGFASVATRLALQIHAFGAPPIASNGINTLRVIDNTAASPTEVRSYSDLAVVFDGTIIPGRLETGGQLALKSDLSGDAIVALNANSRYGRYSINSSGVWTYSLQEGSSELTNALNAINEGQFIEDKFTVVSSSGKYNAIVTIKIYK